MIPVTEHIAIGDEEIQERFVRASGPGGQHVNKTSSAVELRFDVNSSPSLPDGIKARLIKLAGARMTEDGVLVLFVQSTRSQEMNRRVARERLVALIQRAIEPPKPRRPTKPTYASKLRRLDSKQRRSGIKAGREPPRHED